MFVYLLEYRQLNAATNRFESYNLEPYSSKKKIEDTLANILEVNKGYNVKEEPSYGDMYKIVTYNSKSTEGKEMRLRLVLMKKQMR